MPGVPRLHDETGAGQQLGEAPLAEILGDEVLPAVPPPKALRRVFREQAVDGHGDPASRPEHPEALLERRPGVPEVLEAADADHTVEGLVLETEAFRESDRGFEMRRKAVRPEPVAAADIEQGSASSFSKRVEQQRELPVAIEGAAA